MTPESHGELELSVVLVNYNGAACLPATLAALAAGTATESVECLVVDSGSTDGSWEEVSGLWDRARPLRFEQNIGFCAGCNRGAEAAAGRLLAFVNFDGVVEAGWDTPLREVLTDSTVSVATGLLLREEGETVEAAGLAIAFNMATYGLSEGSPRASVAADPADVAAGSGALMMVRREEFLALGGFYEPLFMYGEEADYCLRVPGRIVIHPGSAIRHEYGHASGPHRSSLRLYWGSRNRLVNAARHLPGWALARAVLLSAAFDLVTLAQLRRTDALRAIVSGWRDGLRRIPTERNARGAAERRAAVRRLAPLGDAIREQRRLGRL